MTEQNITPPSFPWIAGVQKDYTMVRIEVQICQLNNGDVYVGHQPLTEEDEKTLIQMPSYGQEQISYALSLEGLRREAYIQLLLKLQDDPEYLNRLKNMDPETKTLEITELSDILIDFMEKTISKLAPFAVEEIIEMLSNQEGA